MVLARGFEQVFEGKPGFLTGVEVQHRVLCLLEQVLQPDVLPRVAREREIGGHAANGRRCTHSSE